VPDAVIKKALQAGHWAPSVGLTDATKYYLIKSAEIKRQLKICLQTMMKKQLHQQIMNNKKQAYKALKLEAIEEAPLGLVICYDRSVLNNFTIGTVGSNEAIKFSGLCSAKYLAFLTEQGYSMGWFHIELLSV
jgi:nicotinate-nucleotide--dimethylbenzimidazole phosphoribosyltransferase